MDNKKTGTIPRGHRPDLGVASPRCRPSPRALNSGSPRVKQGDPASGGEQIIAEHGYFVLYGVGASAQPGVSSRRWGSLVPRL